MKWLSTWLLIAFSIWGSSLGFAQPISIAWQKTMGGNGNDIMQDIYPTADGNYILLGITDQNGIDVNCNVKGWHDTWVVKMDTLGNIIWQQCFGGTLEEGNPFSKIIQTSDGGYLLVTETWSVDGDVTDHHTDLSDAWTIKLDPLGNIVWSHSFGGSNWDVPRNVLELPGKKYLIMSRTSSIDGDVPSYGDPLSYNAWIFIVDSSGNIISNHVYGGTGNDDLYKAILNPNGNITLFGFTSSHDGDLAGFTPDSIDAWLLRINTNGDILSNKIYGAGNMQEFFDAYATADGGYIAFGQSENPGIAVDHGYFHGKKDFWTAKLDANQNLQWQGLYGGSKDERFSCAKPLANNAGYYLAGTTNSNDGDITNPLNEGSNFWIIDIDNNGVLSESASLGGGQGDFCYSITSSGIAVGGTFSPNGDVENLDGTADGWVIQLLDSLNNNINPKHIYHVEVYPNPAGSFANVIGLKKGNVVELKTMLGKSVFTAKSAGEQLSFDVSRCNPGIYYLQVTGGKGEMIPPVILEVSRQQ